MEFLDPKSSQDRVTTPIDSLINAAFIDTAGDDVVNNFSLFGTYDNNGVQTDVASYTPCTAAGCSPTVEYGDGIDAGLDVPVPEPGTLTLFGAALAGLAIIRRRTRNANRETRGSARWRRHRPQCAQSQCGCSNLS